MSKICKYYKEKHSGYFSIYGYGIAWMNSNVYRIIFKEIYGFNKYIKIGKWCITSMKP